MELHEMLTELYKLKVLASCLEDKIIKADITANGEGENVFCLVDLLQEHINVLIGSAGSLKGVVA